MAPLHLLQVGAQVMVMGASIDGRHWMRTDEYARNILIPSVYSPKLVFLENNVYNLTREVSCRSRPRLSCRRAQGP